MIGTFFSKAINNRATASRGVPRITPLTSSLLEAQKCFLLLPLSNLNQLDFAFFLFFFASSCMKLKINKKMIGFCGALSKWSASGPHQPNHF